MLTQPISAFAFDQVHPNPYQTRAHDDPAHVQALAADMRTRGMLQIPIARAKSDAAGHIELAFGHTRFAAWQQAFPHEPFPAEVRFLTDREMAEYAISENQQRKDISAIEKARALDAYLKTFNATQKQAAPLFGLSDASSVSNLLSLLELPLEIQDLVNVGKLPEAHARNLRTVSKYFPTQALTAAQAIADAQDSDRAATAQSAVSGIWNKHAQDLYKLPWDEKWIPDAALSAALYRATQGEPSAPPACAGCKYVHQFSNQKYCAQPNCYALKYRVHAVQEAARLSKKTGIALAKPDEQITVLMDHDSGWTQLENMRKVMKKAARLSSLRYVPLTERPAHPSYYLRDLTGSDAVLLGTTNPAEIKRILSSPDAKAARPAVPANESAAQKQARLTREEKEAAARYQERCDALKTKYDVLWMLEHVASACAAQMEICGGILVKTETLVHADATYNTQISEIEEIHKRLRREVYSKLWGGFADDKALPKKDAPEVEYLRRTHILFDLLATEVLGHRNASETFKWAEAQRTTERIITRGLLLTLPKDWNVPPVHMTAFNCWRCGKFGANENGITKKELAQGWISRGQDGSLGVFCTQEHANAYDTAHANPRPSQTSKKSKAKK